MKIDSWLRVAMALREAAQAHDAVAMLSEKTPYETRGRGGVVRGIALSDEDGLVTARTGLFLDLAQVLERSVEAVAQDVRAGMIRRWQSLDPHREIVIHLDVVDLISR